LGWIDGRKINVDVKGGKEWFYRGDHFRDKGKPFIYAYKTAAFKSRRSSLFSLFYLPLKRKPR
jgi:hypothetical protein